MSSEGESRKPFLHDPVLAELSSSTQPGNVLAHGRCEAICTSPARPLLDLGLKATGSPVGGRERRGREEGEEVPRSRPTPP